MEKYEDLQLAVIVFDSEDVILTSNGEINLPDF